MKQKHIWIYAGVAVGAMVAFMVIHRYIGRKKMEALKRQEMDTTEKVADVQRNFDNNPNSENW